MKSVKYKIKGQVSGQVWGRVINQVWGQVSDQVCDQVSMLLFYIKQYGNPYPTAHLNEKDKD